MLDDFLQDDRQAKRHEDLIGVRAFIKKADQSTFHNHTNKQHDRNGDEDRQRHRIINHERADITEPLLNYGRADLKRCSPWSRFGWVELNDFVGQQLTDRDGAKCAEHEERAVREVDDAESPEYQRQTQSDQRIGTALVEPVQDLQQYGIH
jgi:hypothetical protein